MGQSVKLEFDYRHQYRSSSIPVNAADCNDGGAGNGGAGGGPCKNDGGVDEVERATNSSPGHTSAAAQRTDSLPPFDTFATAFTSPDGGLTAAAATNLGLPFTPSQWKELERQALIYKYMTASVPVPPNLLFSRDSSLPSWNGNGSYLQYSGYNTMNKDMEPGRCKRTDGKKWRCSKDVAPNQKYCERHMHRGRPRSRKHVEQQLRPSSSSGQNNNGTGKAAVAINNNSKKSRLQGTDTGCGATVSDHMIKKEALLLGEQNIFKQPNRPFNSSEEQQQWLHLVDTKRVINAPGSDSISLNPVLQQQCGYVVEEPLNLFSYSGDDFGPGNLLFNQIDHDQSHLYLNNSNGQQGNNPTRGFIDAWSNNHQYRMLSSDQPRLMPYPDHALTLSMALDAQEIGSIGASGCSPASWPPFHSGGPLAEVLGPRNSVPVGSNPASPCTFNGDSISPPATSVSSPTGILHRALYSQSDSSVDNSPTLVASNATATQDRIAFQWLN